MIILKAIWKALHIMWLCARHPQEAIAAINSVEKSYTSLVISLDNDLDTPIDK